MTKGINRAMLLDVDKLYAKLLATCAAHKQKDVSACVQHAAVIKETQAEALNFAIREPRTFIMRWNPEISNHKLSDFEEAMECFNDDDFYYDWSIWDYQDARIGDRFYMLKVGGGNTGVVMSGIFAGMPYRDEDWSGKGREVRYIRMNVDSMIHPDKCKLLTTEALQAQIPDVIWNEGHSGVLLSKIQATHLNSLWNEYLLELSKG